MGLTCYDASMQIQPRFPAPATALQLRAQAPPEDPSWKVDFAGATVGGAALGAAGFYGGLNAGVMLAAERSAGHPITQIVGLLTAGPLWGVYGAFIGTVAGAAVGAGVGIMVARHLARPD